MTQITETDRHTIEVRLLVSARNSGDLFDLRCAVREGMLAFLNREHPEALPRLRNEISEAASSRRAPAQGRPARHDDTHSPGAETVSRADLDAGLPRRSPQ